MTTSKISRLLVLLLVILLLTALGNAAVQENDAGSTPAAKKEAVTEKDKTAAQEGEAKEDDMGKAMGERIANGESVFDVVGIPNLDQFMPSTVERIMLWLLPVLAIAGIVVLVVVLNKRRHLRMMAMIEKGVYPTDASGRRLPTARFRWDLFYLLSGLILVLGGVGLSLYMMGLQGIRMWYVGVIPLLVGAALLIFYRIYVKLQAKE